MNTLISDLSEKALEQGQSIVKQQMQMTKQSFVGQFVAKQKPQQPEQGTSEQGSTPPTQQGPDPLTKDFLKDLYAPSQPQTPEAHVAQGDQKQQEAAQKEQLRKKLWQEQHMETYYNPTFNRPQQQEEPPVAEKLEQEKQQEMMDLEEKKAKAPPPLAVQRAVTGIEIRHGPAG